MADGPERRNQAPAYSAVAFQLMDDVVEKLQIMDYENEFLRPKSLSPYSRIYFAMPATNTSVQFQSFLALTSYLMKNASGDPEHFKIEKFDDPNTSVNKMMLALKNLGFDLDFPASRLKLGHGDAVCAVLNYLTDKSLEQRGFSFNRPVYPDEEYIEEADGEEGADVGEIEDEAIFEEQEEEAMYKESSGRGGADQPVTLTQQMLEPSVDPIIWQAELERVGPKLKVHIPVGKEWRAHIEQTRYHEEVINKHLVDAKEQLGVIGGGIGSALERVTAKEKYINTQFESLRQEYHSVKEKLKGVTETYQLSSDNVSKLTSELSGVSDRLEDVREQLAQRNNSATDTSPLLKIKRALQELKGEIKTFDLRIGVVGHTLMQAKLRMRMKHLETGGRGGNSGSGSSSSGGSGGSGGVGGGGGMGGNGGGGWGGDGGGRGGIDNLDPADYDDMEDDSSTPISSRNDWKGRRK